ncbi:MAG: hypothetical protein RLZZ308_85 [Candidatus Parcubacteria bacterium]|jgi:hypothetical protein
MVPKVDTFAHDISDEIKRQNTTLTEVVVPKGGDAGTLQPPQSEIAGKAPRVFAIMIATVVLIITGIISGLYYYFQILLVQPAHTQPQGEVVQENRQASGLGSVSLALNENIGRYVTKVEKKDKGIIISFSSYPDVFAYMTRNENDYITELVRIFNAPEKATTTQQVITKKSQSDPVYTASSSKTQTSTTTLTTKSTATTTKKESSNATTTQPTASSSVIVSSAPLFKDITLSNINMRMFISDEGTAVYAFISEEKMLIAKTPEDILALKSTVLR